MELTLLRDKKALDRLERVGGADLLIRVIDQFLSSAPLRLDTACDSGKSGNLEGVVKAIHSLKEAASNLGALEVRDLAAQIERLAIQGGKDLILPLLCQLDELLQTTEYWLLTERRERIQSKGVGWH